MYRSKRKRVRRQRFDQADAVPGRITGPKSLNRRVVWHWFILFAVLLGVLKMSLAPNNPIIKSSLPAYMDDIKLKDDHFHGENIVLGEAAFHFKGLKEVPSKLASLKGLGEGSKAAQQSQLDYVKKHKLPLEVENSIGMKFRLAPPGYFIMGSPNDEKGRKKYVGKGIDIESQHGVEIYEPFYVSKFEVTVGEWKAVMGDVPKNQWFFEGDNTPINEVDWRDAINFCKKLAEQEGVPDYRYRLLTEEEWEYVCRAGSETAFCFAEAGHAKHFVEYLDSNGTRTSVVGRKRPNAWGIYNMHGNVMEWCLDYYRDHFTRKLREGKMRNVRGGSWKHELKFCRSANRARLGPTSKGNLLGFRIVRKIQAEIDEKSEPASEENVQGTYPEPVESKIETKNE